MLRTTILAALPLLAVGMAPAAPAFALTMKECGAKYQAAKKANTLKGATWNDFRKAECADDDASDNDAASAVTPEPAKPAAAAAPTTPAKPATTASAAPAKPAPAAKPGAAVFPKSVATKYSDETPGRARLKTCADQYNANKTSGKNGDLKWIQEGGGYWSQCNAKLKS